MTRGLSGTSPANVQSFLGGIDYPADKETLIETARKNKAPDDIIDLLEQFPDEEFDSPVSVMKAYGEVHGDQDEEDRGGRRRSSREDEQESART
ncbi:DUF2795 domain-containing protein [Oligoflexus tunisiensis]|uniref:DUF2795 domain-containing protein n=1 Tax=Oligoflexus tunisiensis TaxID=708132 RepID=UPI00114D282A|nr:DUF2795 domain-containing protein [Oligoflexus tunisiensis]